jgi:hypothetical protein
MIRMFPTPTMRQTIRFLAVLLAALATASTWAQRAQTNPPREAFYRCKDPNGQTQYSNSLPGNCLGRDTEVLSDSGSVLRVIEGDATRTARLQREKVEGVERQERERQAQRDRMLIDTYLTVSEIERLRDQRLELLDAQNRATTLSIKNLRERQSRLEGQIARFKPYNDKPNAYPLPDHLAEEMVYTVNSMRVYEESLGKNSKEQVEVRTAFDGDIKRFKELKGIK